MPNEKELEKLVEKVDAEMISEGVKIPQRPIRAITKIGTMLSLSLPITSPRQELNGPADGNWWISKFIYDWYSSRYGDRTKVDFSVGSLALRIRGDIYLARLPLVFGSIEIYIDRDREHQDPTFSRGPGQFNALDAIPDLAYGLRSNLTDPELGMVHSLIAFGLETALALMGYASTDQFSRLVQADIDTAAAHLGSHNREYGLSKWASLQATEKSLKLAIRRDGGVPPPTHKLQKLLKLIPALANSDELNDAVEHVQCSPGVRYGDEEVTELEALDAHHASIVVTCRVIDLIEKRV